jgi:hypothetical protein
MGTPPLLAGAVKVTVAEALPGVAATPVGAPEFVYGMIEILVPAAPVKGDGKALLVAVTLKV